MNRAALICLVLLAGCSQKAVDPGGSANCDQVRLKIAAEAKEAAAMPTDPFEYAERHNPKNRKVSAGDPSEAVCRELIRQAKEDR